MGLPFASRSAAGCELSDKLRHCKGRDDVAVVGLARGGIPVAAHIACRLSAPLHTLVVERVRVGEHRTYSVITEGGTEVPAIARRTGYSPDRGTILRARQDALCELERVSAHYRRSPTSLTGRCAIIVDDGIASGVTMLAAARAVRTKGASRIVIAAPVASREAAQLLEAECDELIYLAMPKPFNTLSECYLDFSRLSDETCTDILDRLDRACQSHE